MWAWVRALAGKAERPSRPDAALDTAASRSPDQIEELLRLVGEHQPETRPPRTRQDRSRRERRRR